MKRVHLVSVGALAIVFLLAVVTTSAMAYTTKVAPGDGTCAGGNSVTFEWEAREGATTYFLLVKPNDTFSPSDPATFYWTGNVYPGLTGEGNITSKTLDGFPNDGTTFYWWVFALEDLYLGQYGDPWSFTNAPIEVPTRISPADGAAVCDAPSVTFEWEAADCATTYYLLVKTDDIFSGSGPHTIYYTADTYGIAGEGNVTSKTVDGLPVDGTTIYWWVFSGDGNGNFCNLVEVGENGPGTFSSYGPIEVPARSSPEDGAWVYGASATFEWEAAEGANTYWLLVKTDDVMSGTTPNTIYYTGDIYGTDGEGDVTSKTIDGLPADGRDIYWWVWSGRTGTACDDPVTFCNLVEVGNNGPGILWNVPEAAPPCTGSTAASLSQSNRGYGPSGLFKHLAYLLLPIGAVILLTLRRRKR